MIARIRTLDGLRGMAILLVLAGHAIAHIQPLSAEARQWLGAFLNAGTGVRLFFVLSGYLITLLLLDERSRTGAISLPSFYRRRALRIFPAFYFYLLALIALTWWLPTGINAGTFLAASTFTWNYSALWISAPPEGTWNLGHLWTLALEQQFYLFWPFVLIMAQPKRALWIALALAAWCPVARVITHVLTPDIRGYTGVMFHTAIDSLMLGCAAGLLSVSASFQLALRRRGVAGGIVAVFWLLLVSPILGLTVRGFPAALGYTCDALAAAWLIAWLHHQAPAGITRIVGSGLLPKLGVISYSLYLWQQLFFGPEGRLASGDVFTPLICAFAAAVASYHFIEKPFLRLRKTPSSGPTIAALAAERNR